MLNTLRFGLAIGFLATCALVMAGTEVDASKSKVSATFKQMNVPVEGVFKQMTGAVVFDAAKPEQGSAKIDIDTASFDIGEDDYNAEVRKPEWFDSAKYPKASFVSSSLKSLGGGKFQVAGKFSLKGKTQDLSFAMSVKPEAKGSRFEGSFPLSRKAFSIGDPAWGEAVDDAVSVHFVVVQAP
jgi:polyisoprenoid-binding protein YceI